MLKLLLMERLIPMNNFRSLKVVDLFRPLFEKANIDYVVMRKILEVKLIMDGRRVPTIFSGQTKKPSGNQFIKSLGIYMLYGLIIIPFIFMDNYMFQMGLIFGIAMFILMTSMIADFSSVLLDVRDKTILGTKPIHSRTINAAKIVHIAIYMTLLTGAFLLIPMIVMLVVKGVAFIILFLGTVFLFLLFILALTALVYIFVLQFFSGEQLKDIINYIQIILSIGIVIGYQIVIRAFDIVGTGFSYQFFWWHVLLPPFWFAAPFELVLNQNLSTEIITLSILSILIPIISIIIYYRLMPAFERNLQKLLEETGTVIKKKWKISDLWERLICFNHAERKFFRFASKMMGGEREFKLKVYPSLGMALILPFILIYTNLGDSTLAEIGQTKQYLNIYFINIIIGIFIYMVQFSGKYKGAWLFYTVPMRNPKLMYSATMKAFLVNLYLPIFLLIAIIFCFIFSPKIIIDLMVVFCSAVLHAIITYHIVIKGDFPFAQPFESMQQGGANAKMFLLMGIAGIFALLHFFVTFIPFGIFIYLILLILTIMFVWRLSFGMQRVEVGK